MSKKNISVLTFAAVVIIAASIFAFKTKAEEMCYIWNTEAGDSAALRLIIQKSGEVTGSFDFALAEKDRKSGKLEGQMIGDAVHVYWQANAEGKTATEELWIKLANNIAQPGFGEMAEKDGAYTYADPAAVTYPINLQKADCSKK